MIHLLVLLFTLFQSPPADNSLPPEALAALQSGLEAEKAGKLDDAVAEFRKASDLAPASAVVFLQLGNAYMRKSDYATAISPLRRALELSPDSLPAHQMLGFALLARGYAAEAIPHLERVHDEAALGIAQLEAGHPGEAVASLQTALTKNPNDPDLLYYLSRASTELSSESLDRLLSAFPDSARTHQAKGKVYYGMKLYAEATGEYEKALALRSDLPSLHLELGEICEATSQWAKAEQEFRTEAEMQPGNAEAFYRLGDALLHQGKMKEAVDELRRSDTLRPDMPETLYAIGKASVSIDPVFAEQVLNRVTTMEKDTPLAADAYFALAAIHRKQGKQELAARDMREFRRIQTATAQQPRP
jgi:tetratricopeptide (TPR) repeat protein